MKQLPDVQASKTGFPNIPIQKVGVRHIRMPFIFDTGFFLQSVLADFSTYCDLTEETKGINMSRMAETLFKFATLGSSNQTVHKDLSRFAVLLQEAHNSEDIYVKASFSLVFSKDTPATKKLSIETIPVILETRLIKGTLLNLIQINYTGMSLCPCSKEMSLLINNLTKEERAALDYLQNYTFDTEKKEFQTLYKKILLSGFGAHNQKSRIEIKAEMLPNWENPLQDLLKIAQSSVSFPTVAMLKRADEKYVTEASYMGSIINDEGRLFQVDSAGPKFVEDIARSAAESLNKLLDKSINDYVIVVNNEESIHSNDMVATAILNCGRGLK